MRAFTPLKRLILWASISGLSLGTAALTANAQTLRIDTKTVSLENTVIKEPGFKDAFDREVYFRGWNVSGAVKLVETGFKPFRTTADARHGFNQLKRYTGANLVRFTLAWEGTHPAVDTLNYDYLDALIEQLREAFKQDIYVFLDYHTDLYSRHLFDESQSHTGNGAPEWIIAGDTYPKGSCGLLCFSWAQNNVTNAAVRKGFQNFFENAPIQTSVGERHVQDEFLWQLRRTVRYIKSQLSKAEFNHILGVEPFNEPIYGVGHKSRAEEFDNDRLWPFYQRVRTVLNEEGWDSQWVFAEPMVFWDTNAGFFTPPTGGHYLREKPGPGFVFAPHFYDAARMGVTNLNRAENADYFPNFAEIRAEAAFLGLPVLLGEFGMWLKNQDGGHQDYARIVKATYQAMEASDTGRPQKDRRLDFYTAAMPGTQWHWNIYKDQHHELINGNPNKIATDGDGWNDEDFSAIKGSSLTVDPNVIQRAYPRRIQGNLVNLYYNDLAKDGAGNTLAWASIKPGAEQYFADRRFLWTTWQNESVAAPSEFYLPSGFTPANTTLITDSLVLTSLVNSADVNGSTLTIEQDHPDQSAGWQVQLLSPVTHRRQTHFALFVENSTLTDTQLQALQQQLIEAVNEERHPVYLRGHMVSHDYPPEVENTSSVTVTDIDSVQFYVWRLVTLRWEASQPVQVWRNGDVVHTGRSTGKRRFWSRVGREDVFKVCLETDRNDCTRAISFY